MHQLLLLTTFANIIFGTFVFIKSPKRLINQSFSLFTFGLSGWNLTLFLMLTYGVQVWAKWPFFFASLLAAGLFIFSVNFPARNTKTNKLSIIILLTSAFFSLISLTDLVVVSALIKDGFIVGEFGPLYLFYSIFVASLMFSPVIILVYKYIKSSHIFKIQLRYVLLGISLFIIPALFTNLILPTLFDIWKFNTIGPFFSIFMVGFISYAIIKHRLMGIEVVIQRSVFYSLLLTLTIGIYMALIFIVENVFRIMTPITPKLSAGISSIIIVLSFPYLNRYFQKWTNKFFFKDLYDYSETMRELSHILKSTMSLNRLFERAFKVFQKSVKMSRLLVLLHDDFPHFVVQKNAGFINEEGIHHWFNEKVKPFLDTECGLLVAQEIEYNMSNGTYNKKEEMIFKRLLEKMDFYRVSIIIPIFIKTKLMGVLLCGDKMSGDVYTYDDLKLLETFSHQAAIAIENLRLYEDLKIYNEMLEARVDERTRELKKLYTAQSRFLADISHQFQTPLAVIKGNVDLLKSSANSDTFQKAHQIIGETIERLSAVVVNVVSLFKAETNREALNKEKIRVDEILEEIYDEFSVLVEDKEMEFILNKEEVTINGDRQKIKDLLINLISNAVKYTPRKGKIEVDVKKEDGEALIRVADSGCGISEENLPHIFDRFYRLKNNQCGTGIVLGLSLSVWVVKAHQGTIAADSISGKGTIFTVKFPLAE